MTTDIAALDLAKLNGHVDTMEELHDFMRAGIDKVVSFGGESGGKLEDFAQSLRAVLDANTTLTAEVERLKAERPEPCTDLMKPLGLLRQLVVETLAARTPDQYTTESQRRSWESIGKAVHALDRVVVERDAAIARAEKAEASICKTCLDEDRTVALIASWLARKANKARQVGRTGEQQVFGELAADIRAGAWRAKEPV